MKSLLQISKENTISKHTLRHRVERYGILGTKRGIMFVYTKEDEARILTSPSKTDRKPHTRLNHNLIQTFRLMHPTLVAEEVAYALSIDLERVQIAFKQEYLTLPSKMNRD